MATELAKAYVQIIPSAKGIQGNIAKELGGADVGQKAGKAIGTGLVSKLTGIVAAAGIGTMIVKGIASTIQAGSAIQQSLGGVETLFKDSADTVIKNANRAYKTAGMSANAYMENVTGFSASLLQSLGGDTDAAAKVADRAMRDMSDNANKFGTDMSAITYAYQGFAKDNYTMLDNLKLGYGGTKTEMQRLIKDASKMTDIQEKLGVTVDDSSMSFANVANAISVVQESLGITGTTAREAESTFAGSMASMKASFENFKAHLATGQDVSEDLQAIADSVSTFVFDNLLPMLGNIIKGLPGAISGFISDNAGEFAERGKEMLIEVGRGFVRAVFDLGSLFEEAMENFKTFMSEWEPGENLGVAEAIIDAIGSTLEDLIPALCSRFEEGLDNLIEGLVEYDPVEAAQAGNNIIDAIGRGLEEHAPTILAAIGRILGKMILACILGLPKFAIQGGLMILHIIQGLNEKVGELLSKLGEILFEALQTIASKPGEWAQKGKEWVLNVIKGIASAIANLLGTLGRMVAEALGITGSKNGEFKNKGSGMIRNVTSGASGAGGGLRSTMSGLASSALSSFRSRISGASSIGRNIVSGIISGVSSSSGSLFSRLRSLASSALSAAKSALGISSPSKEFAKQVGQWIPAGIAKGIDDNQDYVTSAMSDLSSMTSSNFSSALSVEANGTSGETDMQSMLKLMNGIYGLMQEGQTISIGKRDFARLVNEVS